MVNQSARQICSYFIYIQITVGKTLINKHCAMQIGAGLDYENFQGSMDDVSIFSDLNYVVWILSLHRSTCLKSSLPGNYEY